MEDEIPSPFEVRTIELPGGRLEVTMTEEFIEQLRKRFMLDPNQPVEDDHIRMFIWGAVNAAVKKVEKQ